MLSAIHHTFYQAVTHTFFFNSSSISASVAFRKALYDEGQYWIYNGLTLAYLSRLLSLALDKLCGVVVTDLLDQQDKLVRRLLLVVEFKFCRGGGCSFDQLTER
jgi:hypothetical protein